MEIRKVQASELKFDHHLVKTSRAVSLQTPVIVDKELNVIFGDAEALKASELEVIVVDLPFKETRLAMHSVGRWAEPDWTELKAEDAPKYGYTAFIDGYLFNDTLKHLNEDRKEEVKPTDELF